MKILWILALFISSVVCDLPIHCIRSRTIGEWEFHLNTEQYPLNIRDKRVTCGNGYPNKQAARNRCRVQHLHRVKNYHFDSSEKWQVSLKKNNEATVKTPSKKLEGWWTMMYDEGFGVNLPGYQFFTFFMYLSGRKSHSRSVCGRTMIGWYHDKKSDKIGCFYALQKNTNNRRITYAYSPIIEKLHKEAKKRLHHHYLLRDRGRLGYRARDTELVQDDKTYSKEQLAQAYKIASKWSKVNPKDIKQKDLPSHWDWTNINGVDFVSPVRNQGACGSCYAVATTEAFEARRRIKNLDVTLPNLSVQFLIKCGIFSQACHGGFEYLAALFIKLFGLPPLSELPYDPNNQDTCADVLPKVKTLIKAKGFHFINDIYTKQDEIGMIRQLVAKGPITVGINPDSRFRDYESGIIKKSKEYDSLLEDNIQDVSHKQMKDYGKEWEEVEHAVLIIGYGETKSGIKFWKIRNSWGNRFGYSGDFYLERGTDTMHCESMSIAIDP